MDVRSLFPKFILYIVVLSLLASATASRAEVHKMLPIAPDESLLPIELLGARATLPPGDPLSYANISWPEKETIDQKQLKDVKDYQSEICYSLYWMQKIIFRDYFPYSAKNALIMLPQMERGDDWIITRYVYKDMKIQIIDGRSLTVVLQPLLPSEFDHVDPGPRDKTDADTEQGMPQLKNKENDEKGDVTGTTRDVAIFVNAVFRAFCNYDWDNESKSISTSISVSSRDKWGSYGTISVSMPSNYNWLQPGTISWWSDNKTIVLDFQKIATIPPQSLISPNRVYSSDFARRFVGGISQQDPRSFVRFDKSHAVDFSNELKKYISR